MNKGLQLKNFLSILYYFSAVDLLPPFNILLFMVYIRLIIEINLLLELLILFL